MANVIEKDIGYNYVSAIVDSRSGDEAALDALSISIGNTNTSWNTPISLDSPPDGVGVSTINSELRVTSIDLRPQFTGMNQLTGSIDVSELSNLKEMVTWNSAQNAFDTQYPSALHQCINLEYLYITYPSTNLDGTDMPHDKYEAGTGGILYTNVGKTQGDELSIIHGSVPDDIDNLTKLKWFFMSWTDDWGNVNSQELEEPVTVNGIESISQNIWNITTLVGINIFENWNIAGSGNTFSYPATISHIPNFAFFYAGGGSGTQLWRADEQGFMSGNYPSDMDQLTKLRALVHQRNANLSGFPDFRNSLDMEYVNLTQTDTTGSMPSWMWDGRFTRLDVFSIDTPTGTAMTGTFPPIDENSYNAMDLFNIKDQQFSGTFPEGLFLIDCRKFNISITLIDSLEITDMTHMTNCENFNCYFNDIQGQNIIELDWSRSMSSLGSQWTRLRFENNRYVFQDMLYVPATSPNGETAIELFWQLANQGVTVNFDNQQPAGTANTYNSTDGNGDVVIDDFNSTYGHVDNSYQWQLSTDGGSTFNNITGETSKSLTLTSATSSDNGIYRLEVTNSTFSSLASTYSKSDQTLNSAEITVSL